MMFDPQLDIYNSMYSYSNSKGYSTYTYLPPEEENVEYPFVVMGNTGLNSGLTKYNLQGNITLNIDVWSDISNRAVVSSIMNDLLRGAVTIKGTKDYQVLLDIPNTDQRIINDYSVENTVLIHGIMNFTFKIL